MIRQEMPADYQAIDQLIRDAFATAEHADGNEQDLVKAFRQGDSYIPELALVLEEYQQMIGHIIFTKAKVGQAHALVLAPLSIAPDYQKQGYGKALIEEGHRIAKALGYDLILVLGSDHYYPKFGYLPAQSFGVTIPEGFPPNNFMAISLQGNQHFPGSVSFAKEFGLD